MAPALLYVENLYLVRNNCKKICSEYTIDKDTWKNLRYLNLEGNGIESWDELAGFRNLKEFQYLVINKNMIKEIYYKPGFRNLKQLSFDENAINSWSSFDALNKFDGMIE